MLGKFGRFTAIDTRLLADVDLASPASRAALEPHPKPYWTQVEPGVYLGYYKGARSATWYGRKFIGGNRYKQGRLGRSHDGGRKPAQALTYEEALAALQKWQRAFLPAAAPREAARASQPSASQDDHERLLPSRVDRISEAWAAERPDIDFWLAGFFLRLEYAHMMHERRLGDIAAEAGVNVGDLHVLLALRRNGLANPMRPTDLFRDLLVTSGAITKRLDRLKGANLIERVAATDDRRSELVRLTANGRRIADAAMTRISTNLTKLVEASGVTKAQLRAADDCLRRLIGKM
jgi:DNA-binding MarR family transcriptional regulator